MRYRDITKEQPLEGDPILFWAAKAGKWYDTTYSRAFSDGFRWWIAQSDLPSPTESWSEASSKIWQDLNRLGLAE